jgi:hypothetical protein
MVLDIAPSPVLPISLVQDLRAAGPPSPRLCAHRLDGLAFDAAGHDVALWLLARGLTGPFSHGAQPLTSVGMARILNNLWWVLGLRFGLMLRWRSGMYEVLCSRKNNDDNIKLKMWHCKVVC